MQKRIPFVAALIFLCVIFAWAFWKKEYPSSPPRIIAIPEKQTPEPTSALAENLKQNPAGAVVAAGSSPAGTASTLAAQAAVTLSSSSAAMPPDVAIELDAVQMAIRKFRTEMKIDPVGTNAEITRALLGDNPQQVKIPVPAGSQLNGKGELCDRWGTPYFFHQVSHDRMEIRSAGPDREMWTDDDLELK